MPTQYPAGLDDFENPVSGGAGVGSTMAAVPHSVQHQNANDAIEAIEAYVGAQGDTSPDTITGRVKAVEDGKSDTGHTHPISDVTGLQSALDSKAAASHAHPISDVTNLQTTLDGKSNVGHGHAVSDVTGLQTALDGKAPAVHNHAISDVTGLQGALDGKAAAVHTHTASDVTDFSTTADARITAQKGQANGLATLNESGLIPANQLPSFVDDVLEYVNLAAFPGTGESGKIYVALDTGRTYRWSGTVYSEISPGTVISVNGQTGAVSLTTDNIAEGAGNLYHTVARVRAALSATAPLTYDSSTGAFGLNQSGIDHGSIGGLGDDDHTQYHNDGRALTWLGTRSTTDLSEGNNKYYTDERVDDRIAALLQQGANITLTYDDENGTLSIAASSFHTTSFFCFAPGCNLVIKT